MKFAINCAIQCKSSNDVQNESFLFKLILIQYIKFSFSNQFNLIFVVPIK